MPFEYGGSVLNGCVFPQHEFRPGIPGVTQKASPSMCEAGVLSYFVDHRERCGNVKLSSWFDMLLLVMMSQNFYMLYLINLLPCLHLLLLLSTYLGCMTVTCIKVQEVWRDSNSECQNMKPPNKGNCLLILHVLDESQLWRIGSYALMIRICLLSCTCSSLLSCCAPYSLWYLLDMVFDDVVHSSFSKTILGTSSPMIAEFLGFYMQTFFCLLKPLPWVLDYVSTCKKLSHLWKVSRFSKLSLLSIRFTLIFWKLKRVIIIAVNHCSKRI